jgi:hypothetical protein
VGFSFFGGITQHPFHVRRSDIPGRATLAPDRSEEIFSQFARGSPRTRGMRFSPAPDVVTFNGLTNFSGQTKTRLSNAQNK